MEPLPPPPHRAPRDLADRLALGLTRLLRFFADPLFASRYGHRAIVLETIAAVPGMVGATATHLHSLRRMVFAMEVDTLTHGIIETEGGTLISVVSSMVAATEQKVTLEADGEKGTALYADRPFPQVKFVGMNLQKERPPTWGVHALQRSLAGFANWVLNDQPFLTPAASTLPVLAAVDAIYLSANTGQRSTVESLAFVL